VILGVGGLVVNGNFNLIDHVAGWERAFVVGQAGRAAIEVFIVYQSHIHEVGVVENTERHVGA